MISITSHLFHFVFYRVLGFLFYLYLNYLRSTSSHSLTDFYRIVISCNKSFKYSLRIWIRCRQACNDSASFLKGKDIRLIVLTSCGCYHNLTIRATIALEACHTLIIIQGAIYLIHFGYMYLVGFSFAGTCTSTVIHYLSIVYSIRAYWCSYCCGKDCRYSCLVSSRNSWCSWH